MAEAFFFWAKLVLKENLALGAKIARFSWSRRESALIAWNWKGIYKCGVQRE